MWKKMSIKESRHVDTKWLQTGGNSCQYVSMENHLLRVLINTYQNDYTLFVLARLP